MRKKRFPQESKREDPIFRIQSLKNLLKYEEKEVYSSIEGD